MHPTQQKILDYVSNTNISKMSLREIGDNIGEHHPQLIKHHLDQLLKKGLILYDAHGRYRTVEKNKKYTADGLQAVPVISSSQYNKFTKNSYEDFDGFISLSSKLLSTVGAPFAIKINSNSIGKSSISQLSVHDGDYIIIDKDEKIYENGDLILLIINNMADVRRYFFDKVQNQIVLIPESYSAEHPIVIDTTESEGFIKGKIIRYIKSDPMYYYREDKKRF